MVTVDMGYNRNLESELFGHKRVHLLMPIPTVQVNKQHKYAIPR